MHAEFMQLYDIQKGHNNRVSTIVDQRIADGEARAGGGGGGGGGVAASLGGKKSGGAAAAPQTLNRVLIDARAGFFAHRQLYVGLSGVTHYMNMALCVTFEQLYQEYHGCGSTVTTSNHEKARLINACCVSRSHPGTYGTFSPHSDSHW